jgi:hypothetical protein
MLFNLKKPLESDIAVFSSAPSTLIVADEMTVLILRSMILPFMDCRGTACPYPKPAARSPSNINKSLFDISIGNIASAF